MSDSVQSALSLEDLDLLPYGIIVLDEVGIILFYNEREEQIARRDRLDVLGLNFFTEVAPCANVAAFYGRFREVMASAGQTAAFAFSFPFEPARRDVEISITSFRIDERALCLLVVQDVSEIESVREKIASSREFASVGEVAAGVAHNFNNVLMAAAAWLGVLNREMTEATPRAKRAVSEISRAITDGRTMIGRIRGPLESANLVADEVDVNDAVAAAVHRARARMNASNHEGTFQVDLSLGARLPKIFVPAGEFDEVIVNVVVNALEAVEHGGTVSVTTGIADGKVQVIVRDTGTGMSESTQKKVFQPLFTTKGPRGTALGLSTAYSAVRRFGGTIALQSVSGQGTAFTISLPYVITTRLRTA